MPTIGGLYQGMEFRGVPSTNASGMDSYIEAITTLGFENKIISLFYFPHALLSYDNSTTPPTVNNSGVMFQLQSVSRPTLFGNYEPRNKKLYTYPYMFLCIDCLQNAKCYKWEKGSIDSETGNAYIPVRIYGALSINPALVIVPSYDGMASNLTEAMYMNFTDGLTCYSNALFQLFGDNGIINKLTNLGVGAVTTYANPNFDMLGLTHNKGGNYAETAMDRFEGDSGEWQSGTAIKRRGTTETFGKDLLAQKRAENDLVMKIGQSLIDMSQFHLVTTRVRGSGGNYDKITGHQEIYFKSMTIKEEFARKIDKFFDAYGYAVNTIKVPAIHNRPKWSYVRTRGCVIKGNIPDKYRTEMCNTFDSGIRFWAVGAGGNVDIGNYNQDNSPQTE